MSNACYTDGELFDALKKGDYVGYNKLFERYYVRLCRYVYTLLENTEDAEDVVQELFLRLWKNRKQIEIRENVEGYLFRMAKHLALNELRSKPHFQELPGETEQAALSCSYEDTRVETEEFRRALFGCMDLLPERAKEVFLLHRMKGLKQQEIAEKLDISVKTIKNQIWASLQRLRKCLDAKGIWESSNVL